MRSAQLALVTLMLYLSFITCEVFYIMPSTTYPCPQDPQIYFTLKQFTDNIYSNTYANMTLIFLPGNHTLDSDLNVMNLSEFSMYSDVNIAWISCKRNGFLTFINVKTVQIRNLAFLGCGENILHQINLLTVQDSIFQGYYDSGTALYIIETVANIAKSLFVSNTGTFQHPVDEYFLQEDEYKEVGGAITAFQSKVRISECTFRDNSAELGGALFLEQSIISINNTTFDHNFANPYVSNQTLVTGGVMVAYWNCVIVVKHSNFTNNSGLISDFLGGSVIVHSNITIDGCIFQHSIGSMFIAVDSNLTDYNSVYKYSNSTTTGDVLNARSSNVIYIRCQFTYNRASFKGGVINAYNSVITLQRCDLNHNRAMFGGVISTEGSNICIENCTITYNTALAWSAIQAFQSNITTENTIFYKNNAGIIFVTECRLFFKYITVRNNSANNNRGLLYAGDSTIQSSYQLLITGNLGDASTVYLYKSKCNFTGRFTFSNNFGSFLVIKSLVTFDGITTFLDCSQPADINLYFEKGGAVTNIESTTYFIGKTVFIGNHARISGGAIHAVQSTIHMSGDTTIANNSADNSAGGVYLYQSKLNCVHNCSFSGNTATTAGGAIHAIASTVYANDVQRGIWTPLLWAQLQLDIQQSIINDSPFTTIILSSNEADKGGGLALEMYSKLYGNDHMIIFKQNLANYGGAIFVNDYTSSGTCASKPFTTNSALTECFTQMLNYHGNHRLNIGEHHYQFVDNYAAMSGPSLYGGLLDRCTESPVVDIVNVYIYDITSVTPASFSRAKRSIEEIDIDVALISSDPVRICFCRDMDPDCSYQWPTTRVKKGHPFVVNLVAVDQVSHVINATIRSSLSSHAGGLGEGQQSQSTHESCTNLTFNAFSPRESEKLTLYAEGPCNNMGISKRKVKIHFSPCTCPIGFQPMETGNTKCDCVCDPQLYPYITNCNSATESLLREDTIWVGYHTEANHSGYLIYRYCPYDYCRPPTPAVAINLNIPNGADSQCALNRSRLLCGACKAGFSLSLGSTRCILCSKRWPGLLIAILLATVLAGVALVAFILILNLTVATGTLNGLIFYANIIAANYTTYMPISHPNVITMFIAWLNLDVGIDGCFYDGIDAYIKQWLQFAFPAYVILMVATVIFISERSSRFAKLIGKGNPVATLATLILLSYAKLLRAIINIFSFAILKYPNGLSKVVWLPDANVLYLNGKHIPLFLAAIVVVTLGLVYTLLLFSWQWLLQLQLPNKRIFRWIWNTRLNSFMDAYLAPHTPNHRYWTGLLLFVRVILYLVAALNLSNNPRVNLLAVSLAVSSLFILKAVLLVEVYRKWPMELLEFAFYFNLLLFTLASFYSLGNLHSQRVVAYTSTSIALVLFLGILSYHILCVIYNTQCVKMLKIKITHREHLVLDNVHTAFLADDSSDILTSAVAPTSTVVEMSPQHSTQDSTIGQESSKEQTPSDRLESSRVLNNDHQTACPADHCNANQLQLLSAEPNAS